MIKFELLSVKLQQSINGRIGCLNESYVSGKKSVPNSWKEFHDSFIAKLKPRAKTASSLSVYDEEVWTWVCSKYGREYLTDKCNKLWNKLHERKRILTTAK